MNPHDDKNIWLERLAKGDHDAFRSLFENYFSPLLFFAESYVKSEETARDIVQDLFLKLTDHKEIFSSVTNLKSYLYTTVKNSCIKQLEHQAVRNRYSSNILTTYQDEERFWIKVLEEETYRILYQSIEKLPPQTRAVYQLSMNGLKNQEIADKLEISLETVKTHKQIGKKYLQKYMKDLFFILSIFKI
ncbi:MAG: RNA polymerase sigma-70 factor [Bacteroidales bacterium]|nr:RNA polymerase sigma-70 factor [Bacteroidales bacterium]MDD2426097.1 RNA polymerase sigma-70 factor [Bacteroidales bacterium]MDD3990345.1 RNA polymerase sigma-70 factor [Bacteroidales bacterium]